MLVDFVVHKYVGDGLRVERGHHLNGYTHLEMCHGFFRKEIVSQKIT